jgi:hypothetical protein
MTEVSIDVLRGVTQRVVDLYTREGFLFTALDVSNSVKQTLPSVRHREVAPIVRDLFANGSMGDAYAQTLIDVVADRKTVQAFLYHLKGADIASGYDEDKRRQLAIPPVTASLDENEELAQGETEANLTVGADGRLRVPRKLLTLANITTPRVTAERVGDEIFLAVLLSDTAAPARATVLELHHPTLLHVPASLAAMFDDEEPIKARVERFHVRISGTLADGE